MNKSEFYKKLMHFLPNIEEIVIGNQGTYYGAERIMQDYCSINKLRKPIPGEWQHGWVRAKSTMHPKLITSSVTGTQHDCYWVARKDQESFLRSEGYTNVTAIGLPIIYLPDIKIPRIKGSLLVMPSHSLDYTEHNRNGQQYVNEIAGLKEYFKNIVICIHPSCKKHGYWINEFKDMGFEIITGALITDRNALKRMQILFSFFEFMTTNSIGSHVVYGAFFGCKVSIYGKYVENRPEDYCKAPLYVRNPSILGLALEDASEIKVKERYPQFFVHPSSAKEQIEFGKFEIGFENKKSHEEMIRLFKWTSCNTILFYLNEVKKIIKKIYKKLHNILSIVVFNNLI